MTPQVGYAFVLVAFTTVVLGGMGSFVGALVAGLLLGVIEALCGLFWVRASARSASSRSSSWLLLFRPTGLFGARA